MTKNMQIADGTMQQITVGDKVRLKDGRVVEIFELGAFGRFRATDAEGSIVFPKGSEIVEVVKDIAETIEKVQDFFLWFKETAVGAFILSLFKKKPNA